MADLLSSHQEPSHLRKLLLIGLVVAAAIAAGFGVLYHRENHPQLQASATGTLVLPFHFVYGQTKGGSVVVGGSAETEDSTYIVPLLRIQNRSEYPLFLKDLASEVTLQDGRNNPGRLIGARDRARLQQMVPGIAPLLKQANLPPLDPEQQIPPNGTAQGYAIFLYTMPSTEWDKRQSANVRIDFYHQDAVTVPLPR